MTTETGRPFTSKVEAKQVKITGWVSAAGNLRCALGRGGRGSERKGESSFTNSGAYVQIWNCR